jgi:uncharacterized protein
MITTARAYIDFYQMQAHPEGGFFKEIYKNPQEIQFSGFDGLRSVSTSILFLLEQGQQSKLHRIKSDEIWYFHAGQALEILEHDEQGNLHITRLGPDVLAGDKLQHVVPAGRWFGAKLPSDSMFALVGCQVSPGFDFRDFELAPEESRYT